MKQVLDYGSKTIGYFAIPHPTKKNEFIGEKRECTVIGFSHPNHRNRDWGWRGDILVKDANGNQTWNTY